MRNAAGQVQIMTQLTHPHDLIRATLLASGQGPAAIEALLALDTSTFHFVRQVKKGDLPQSLIDEIGAGLELTQFHALTAVTRIQGGFLRPAQEVTVGLLAEEMALDPSRASRISADLVERGLLQRAVSQEDGRRAVLQLTEAGRALMEAFLAAKWARTLRLFADWSEADIVAFARLFGRYQAGMRALYPGEAK